MLSWELINISRDFRKIIKRKIGRIEILVSFEIFLVYYIIFSLYCNLWLYKINIKKYVQTAWQRTRSEYEGNGITRQNGHENSRGTGSKLMLFKFFNTVYCRIFQNILILTSSFR